MPYDFICKSAQLELEHIMDAGYQTMGRWDLGTKDATAHSATVDGDCGGHLCCRESATTMTNQQPKCICCGSCHTSPQCKPYQTHTHVSICLCECVCVWSNHWAWHRHTEDVDDKSVDWFGLWACLCRFSPRESMRLITKFSTTSLSLKCLCWGGRQSGSSISQWACMQRIPMNQMMNVDEQPFWVCYLTLCRLINLWWQHFMASVSVAERDKCDVGEKKLSFDCVLHPKLTEVDYSHIVHDLAGQTHIYIQTFRAARSVHMWL